MTWIDFIRNALVPLPVWFAMFTYIVGCVLGFLAGIDHQKQKKDHTHSEKFLKTNNNMAALIAKQIIDQGDTREPRLEPVKSWYHKHCPESDQSVAMCSFAVFEELHKILYHIEYSKEIDEQ